EMEGAAIAQVCYMNQIPFCVIRCISDSSDDSAGDHSVTNEKMASDGSAALILAYLEE
ncbi:MAG: 5'-methylthioadenosine/adenosylhomocysteine nucleosidase, partial [Lachnospiraceae bacterium]|nr:5'-methylthioadenosine/adenosylhomocysteine nucleosidase [Lachnospiraceae bacterium]